MINNNYALVLQRQINQLQYAYNEKELITVMADTCKKFPVQQAVMARIYCEGLQFAPVPEHISYSDLLFTRNLYIEILQDELSFTLTNEASFNIWSEYALNILYFNPPYFTPNCILHECKNGRLKVSDLLSVVGYAKKIIESLGIKVEKRYGITLMVLNTIDLVLHNQKEDKPFNKALHLANDVLSEIAQNFKPKLISDSQFSSISLSFDLAIDFLVKR